MISKKEMFMILLWKNWVLQWRRKTQFVIRMLLTVFFSFLLILLRILVDPVSGNKDNRNNPVKQYSIPNKNFRNEIGYSPKNIIFGEIVDTAAKKLQLNVTAYNNAAELKEGLVRNSMFCGVEFPDGTANITSYPKNFQYVIRFPGILRTKGGNETLTWLTNFLVTPLDPNVQPSDRYLNIDDLPDYISEGFIAIQEEIAEAYVTLASESKNVWPDIFLQSFPSRDHMYDPLLPCLTKLIALIIVLCFIYPCINIVQCVTLEKEKHLKEIMVIMGLRSWIHWAAWFVWWFIIYGALSFIIVIILKAKFGKESTSVLTYSSFSALLCFLLVYSTTSITLCFFLSSCFHKATTAATVTCLLWVIMHLPYLFISVRDDLANVYTKLGFSLLSNTALGLGMQSIIKLEMHGEGLQWNNMFLPVTVGDTTTVGYIIIIMMSTSILHLVLCLYVEQIYPGEYIVGKKWNYIFMKSFWFKEIPEKHITRASARASFIEHDIKGRKQLLYVRRLRKEFGSRVAVENVTLHLYENEITVLLGHNGAGKTTTISMLTGLCVPTSGTAIINGYDLKTNLEDVRSSMSVCPQYNILFDDLTVRDHLTFYGRVKGLKDADLEAEIKSYISKIGIQEKQNTAVGKLSTEEKRKLTICATLCGGSKVVLCDEPTLGLDPTERRHIWDILRTEKEGRTILVTTRSWNDADVFADSIAILTEGVLTCCGSMFYLRNLYGVYYKVICVKQPHCITENITDLFNKYLTNTTPISNTKTEVIYQINIEDNTAFVAILKDLEDNIDTLGIASIAISETTVENVFMKNQPKTESFEKPHTRIIVPTEKTRLKGRDLAINCWLAMFLKKYFVLKNYKFITLIHNMLPVSCIIFTLLLADISKEDRLPSLEISLGAYSSTITLVENNPLLSENLLTKSMISRYVELIKSHGEQHQVKTINTNIYDYFSKFEEEYQTTINREYISAVAITDAFIVGYYNNKHLHSIPLTLNLVHNILAKEFIGDDASIKVSNHPLPFTDREHMKLLKSGNNTGLQLAINVVFCMCIVTSFYSIFIINEKQSGAKFLQYLSGVDVTTYWLTHYIVDMITFSVTALLIVISLFIMRFCADNIILAVDHLSILLFLFGFSSMPLTYMVCYYCNEAASGLTRISIMYIFFGVGIFIVTIVLRQPAINMHAKADEVTRICLLSPHFALANSMEDLYVNTQTQKYCDVYIDLADTSKQCLVAPECCEIKGYWAWEKPGIGKASVYLLFTRVFTFGIVLLRDYNVFTSCIECFCKKKSMMPSKHTSMDGTLDEDVQKETDKVNNLEPTEIKDHNLVVLNLSKYFGQFLAVNQICFTVNSEECFGILGIDGAGKTTIIKMVAGDQELSSGNIYSKGLSVLSTRNRYRSEIGYCPQDEALFTDLTGSETLRIYALLGGIPWKEIYFASQNWATLFDFERYLDTRVAAYSGSSKRKLSIAIAVITKHAVLLLDEPTTGMDSISRTRIWNALCMIRDSGAAIVVATHNAQECEALCTRLVFMVDGQFKCIGTSEYLKTKFSRNTIMKIKLKQSKYFAPYRKSSGLTWRQQGRDMHKRMIITFILEKFPSAFLQEQFEDILTFYTPPTSFGLSHIFEELEEKKEEIGIDDYLISQTTLEEIFLNISKK